ncbi:MAG: DUF4845 domain-containing protein [Gammaproteobacteria bacterium]|nr:DUF4845 domain-containing protein [Gammaproteobacteria bacterium]
MKKYQSGASTWTTMTFVLMLIFFSIITFKVSLIYLDHGIIKKSMQEIVNQRNFESMSSEEIMVSMDKRMIIDNIRGFDKKAFQVKRTDKGEKYIIIEYDKVESLFGDISIIVKFKEDIKKHK